MQTWAREYGTSKHRILLLILLLKELDLYPGHGLEPEMVVSLGKDETLPESQVNVLADFCANREICALVKESTWRMQFMPFN